MHRKEEKLVKKTRESNQKACQEGRAAEPQEEGWGDAFLKIREKREQCLKRRKRTGTGTEGVVFQKIKKNQKKERHQPADYLYGGRVSDLKGKEEQRPVPKRKKKVQGQKGGPASNGASKRGQIQKA